MSYNITFKVKAEGFDKWIAVGDCDANITWNVRRMIEKSTGLPWLNEADNGLCMKVIPEIEKGLAELTCNRSKYEKYESPNGRGTVTGCIGFYKRILSAWEDLIRMDEELAMHAHFWIE